MSNINKDRDKAEEKAKAEFMCWETVRAKGHPKGNFAKLY